jgi:hypothetical protein
MGMSKTKTTKSSLQVLIKIMDASLVVPKMDSRFSIASHSKIHTKGN